ncbi:hypothetical protein D3C72_1765430 [compost metagenome]
MRHHVDFPDALPVIGARLQALAQDDAGVRAEDVDLAKAARGLVGQALHGGGIGHVDRLGEHLARRRRGLDLGGNGGGAGRVQVGHSHAARAGLRKGQRQRAPDAGGRAGHHDGLVAYFHGLSPR